MLTSSRPVAPPPEARPAGTAEACVRLFENEFDYVHRTLRRFGVTPTDADDLTQEVFMVVWRRRRDWDPTGSLRPWLAGIAFRVAIAHRRRRAREVPGGLVDLEDPSPRLEDQMASADARQMVLDVLASLPPKQRLVLVLHEIDGVPMKDVAASLKLPLFTAYSRLRAARAGLAKAVKRRQLARRDKIGGLAGVLPAGWLELERPIPPAPAGSKTRALARLREHLADHAEIAPGSAPRAGLRPPSSRFWSGVGGALGVALVAGVVILVGILRGKPADKAIGKAAALGPLPSAEAVNRSVPIPGGGLRRAMPAAVVAPALAPGDDLLAEQLGRGMVGYWRFDEDKGAPTAQDMSGQGGDCVIRARESSDFMTGSHGGAVRLGRNWLECPTSPALARISTEITISAWILPLVRQDNLRAIVARQHATGHEDDYFFGMARDQLLFSGKFWGRLLTPLPQTLGRWFHVAVTRDKSGTVTLYIDGTESNRKQMSRRLVAGNLTNTPYANALLVGAANNEPDPRRTNQRFNGGLDELVIYDRALAGREIAALARGLQPRLR